jgi:O-antigen ligase
VRQFLVQNRAFLLIFLLWIVSGAVHPYISLGVVPLSLLFFRSRRMYMELLVGFFLVLIFSDSRQPIFEFADKVKDVYLLFLLIFFVTDTTMFQPFDTTVKRFIPFLVIAFLSVFFSPIILTSFQKTFSFTILIILVPNYMLLAMRARRADFVRFLVWSLISFLALGLIIRMIYPSITILDGRYCGLMGNPNGIGLFAVTTMIFVILTTENRTDILNQRQKIFAYAIIIFSLILSGSRNAIFTGMIFLVFRQFYKISPIIGFLGFVFVIFVYQLIESNFALIVVSMGLEEYFRLETLQSGSGRIVAWNFAWENISSNPILGSGWGYTEDLFKRNYAFLSIQGHQGNAHNSYLTFWLDTGLFGLLFYLVGLIRSFIISARYTRSAIPIMYALGFHAFFESWLTGSLNPFTIQLLLMLTFMTYSSSLDEEEEEEGEEAEDETGDDEVYDDSLPAVR